MTSRTSIALLGLCAAASFLGSCKPNGDANGKPAPGRFASAYEGRVSRDGRFVGDPGALETALGRSLFHRMPTESGNSAEQVALGTVLLSRQLDQVIELLKEQNALLRQRMSEDRAR